jgi:stage II sporulation protein D
MQYRRRSGGLALLFFVLAMAAVPMTTAQARVVGSIGAPGSAPSASASTRPAWTPHEQGKAYASTLAKPTSASKRKPTPKPGWLVERVRIEPLAGGGTVAINEVGEYRGAVEVVPTGAGGQVAVVNDVGLEDYVRGLAEVPSSWPMEAQKAQAIAARTYALHELNLDPGIATAARGVGAQICATDACQVYAGVAKERNPETAATFGSWAEAVAQTKDEVILFQNAPISAKYSSSNGGRSISGGRPYLKVFDDPDDRFSPLHRWRSQLLGTDVANALGLTGGVVQQLTRSGDQLAVVWQGPDGGSDRLQIHANDFRAKLNASVPPPAGLPRPVPFPRFAPSADASTNTVILDGGGWGHGIGMSQWGAYGKALRGMKTPDILAAYYGGLRPTRVDPAKLPKSLRVAVDLGRPAADLAATAARVRILDQKGAPIAVAATGGWRFVPEGAGVRVLPPPDQLAGPALEPLAVDPAAPTADGPITVRFRLTAPAVVHVTVRDEAGTAMASIEPRLVEAGDLTQAIPGLAQPGRYTVTIAADAGGGRTAALPMPVEIRPSNAQTIGPVTAAAATNSEQAQLDNAAHGPHPADRNAMAALAMTLLMAVGARAARSWREAAPTTLKRR